VPESFGAMTKVVPMMAKARIFKRLLQLLRPGRDDRPFNR
jgi:hypothetical protein